MKGVSKVQATGAYAAVKPSTPKKNGNLGKGNSKRVRNPGEGARSDASLKPSQSKRKAKE